MFIDHEMLLGMNGRFAPLAEIGHGTHDLAELPPAL
jgi:hypothetical protein